jgi:hypothetical protein
LKALWTAFRRSTTPMSTSRPAGRLRSRTAAETDLNDPCTAQSKKAESYPQPQAGPLTCLGVRFPSESCFSWTRGATSHFRDLGQSWPRKNLRPRLELQAAKGPSTAYQRPRKSLDSLLLVGCIIAVIFFMQSGCCLIICLPTPTKVMAQAPTVSAHHRGSRSTFARKRRDNVPGGGKPVKKEQQNRCLCLKLEIACPKR